MLNCTDLACVLHHHHFYAHLHHLKNHLQDDNDNGVLGDGDGSDVSGNYISQLSNNESDAPNDTIYMVCGVVIAMLLVGLIIILVAVTINKLRKREESSSPSPIALEAQQQYTLQTRFSSLDSTNCGHEHHLQHHQEQQLFNTTPSIIASALTEGNGHLNNNNNNSISNNSNNNNNHHLHPHNGIIFEEPDSVTFVRTSGVTTNGWIFPPKAPTPNIYNCINHDLLAAANHQNGFKGFRKQFSGRFKRLVSKKSESTSPIPPELRPQLKTIYVY
ncbi:putative uncharacterized protein DDB_G0272194 isoform X2 [Glossina fuscipes]|uniref:Uncharacterized protein n=1 Tax=Glossina fuscipes TaxID=7396 RepID=A0A9C5ZF54_9MUSC|nr:putative uncharacterized protein DDB_G0272194 isoform X2 [Glossina fuscipes]